MLVCELIEKLKAIPQDQIVLGRGYESGYDPINGVFQCKVYHIPDHNWYDGEYDTDTFNENVANIDAVILGNASN